MGLLLRNSKPSRSSILPRLREILAEFRTRLMFVIDFLSAAVVILGLAVAVTVIARMRYRQLHPPPGREEIIAGLEEELKKISKEMEGP